MHMSQLHGMPLAEARGQWALDRERRDSRPALHARPRLTGTGMRSCSADQHRDQGMLSFGVAAATPATPALSVSDANDIHAYVIDRAWAAFEQQQRERKGP